MKKNVPKQIEIGEVERVSAKQDITRLAKNTKIKSWYCKTLINSKPNMKSRSLEIEVILFL